MHWTIVCKAQTTTELFKDDKPKGRNADLRHDMEEEVGLPLEQIGK